MATFLITDSDNWIVNNNFHYLLGFQPSLWGILLQNDKVHIFLDKRYFAKTKRLNKKELSNKAWKKEVEYHELNWPLVDAMLLSIPDSKSIQLEQNLTLKYYHDIDDKSDLGLGWKWKKIVVIENYFDEKRIIKDDNEIKEIKHAVDVIDKVSMHIQYLVDTEQMQGKTESEIRAIIINQLLKFGWEDESFEAIVAFWEHSSIAHHTAWDTIIWNGPLLIDMWAKYHGYCSDFTRTFWIWKKNDDYDEYQNIYKSVKKAHIKATLWARVGMKASQIDLLARKSIEKDGYGDYFSHSTWHGIWISIHERPWINRMSDEVIKTWMVFTIEPWIYIPGKFWVRIENIVVAKEERIKCLSKVLY